jgi:iron complex outermembrane receptor protein
VSQTVNGVVNPNYNRWVASTPGNTEGLGLTYQQKFLDFGIFNKRIGSMWNDGGKGSTVINQYVPIDSFNMTNLFFNVTMRKGSFFDQSKLRLSFNNLFDTKATTSLTPALSGPTYVPNSGDTLGLLAGRSVTVSFVIGLSPRRE